MLCFTFVLILIGCHLARKKSNQPPVADEERHVAESISLIFLKPDTDTTLIYSFYKQRNFQPAWVDDQETTEEIVGLLESAPYYGLDSADYNAGKIKHLLERVKNEENDEMKNELFAKADLELTRSYLLFASHASKGRLDPETLEERDSIVNAPLLVRHLENALDQKNIRESIETLEPKQAEYVNLKNGLGNYLRQVELYADTIHIPDPEEDSVACYAKVTEILVAQNYLDSLQADNDSMVVYALKKFQGQHGLNEDGRPGPNTIKALSVSTYERYKQIAVNLEKWRWENDWSNRYVFVNIPAYHLKVYDKGKPQLMLKVITGKASSPTPELSSEFQHLVTNPLWNVPTSIYSNELLPEIKENPQEYLSKHNYKVIDKENNTIVHPDSVDWDNAKQYRIRQDAGSFNALGRIKFDFTNKYQVYLHDTPSRRLFEKEVRSMSHGCVRVQDPLKLAEFLLKAGQNDHTANDVEKLISHGAHSYIPLEEKVPLHIRYFTCEADSNKNVYFYSDVYGKDEAIKEKLFNDRQRQVALF